MKQDTYEYWKDQMEKDKARLKELEEKGIAALSQYDIKIAYMGNAEMGLKYSKQLKRNHIKYDLEQIAKFEKKGIQEKLF